MLSSQLQGTIVEIFVSTGDAVPAGAVVALIESMKLHHEVAAPTALTVVGVSVAVGDTVRAGDALIEFAANADTRSATSSVIAHHAAAETSVPSSPSSPDQSERGDLLENRRRHEQTLDAARVEAVTRRHRSGRRTARENLADLVDPGSFVEYGPLVIAAQRRRRALDDLIANTPADGLVGGLATVNASIFNGRAARCIAMSYDYMVLAGTQGAQNHRKKDRLFEIARHLRVPIVFFTEGGGGRPGDTDTTGVSGLDCLAFRWFAELSGLVPLVGINSGYCFAGNAAILGCCDVVIATRDSNIGMGGPAMIEGGGLGTYAPQEIGPADLQSSNGVIDLLVEDDAEAVAMAKRYLSYFQGHIPVWESHDPAELRAAVPADRLRAYDMRRLIECFADIDSVLELRSQFGLGMITALIRIEGRPVGLIANNPAHLAGAIDTDAADKAARFMQLCDAFGLPIITLCDTPGMMVGPDVEATALVRHCSRLFVVGANLRVPLITIVTRKAYGLGAQAMMGGSTKAPLACVAWPTGEFGGMGLEGAVRLGYRKELEAATDDAERDRLFAELVARLYEHGRAVSVASYFEIDDVIDPAESRRWVSALLDSVPEPNDLPGDGHPKRRPNIDTW